MTWIDNEIKAELREFLSSTLLEMKKNNPNASLRRLAQRLNMSPSALSEILRAKRSISFKVANRIVEKLACPPKLREKVINHKAEPKIGSVAQYTELPLDSFNLVSEWYYFAILSLTETESFNGTIDEIKYRLGLTDKVANEACERLLRLGLLEVNSDHKLSATGKQFFTGTDMPNPYLKNQHYQNLELARRSLDQDEQKDRDFSFISIAVDPEDLSEMKKEIQNFRREFCQKYEAKAKKEVFRLCLQLFQLSKTGELK